MWLNYIVLDKHIYYKNTLLFCFLTNCIFINAFKISILLSYGKLRSLNYFFFFQNKFYVNK